MAKKCQFLQRQHGHDKVNNGNNNTKVGRPDWKKKKTSMPRIKLTDTIRNDCERLTTRIYEVSTVNQDAITI